VANFVEVRESVSGLKKGAATMTARSHRRSVHRFITPVLSSDAMVRHRPTKSPNVNTTNGHVASILFYTVGHLKCLTVDHMVIHCPYVIGKGCSSHAVNCSV
jgi:hypothetical protein